MIHNHDPNEFSTNPKIWLKNLERKLSESCILKIFYDFYHNDKQVYFLHVYRWDRKLVMWEDR